MPVLNDADAMYLGGVAVDAVFLGAEQVWSGMDPDVKAYLTATGLDPAFAPTLDVLVAGLKRYGLWSKMAAIYPFIGGTEALHRWNLKDPRDTDDAYRLTFNFGTHTTALGYRPNPVGQTNNAPGRADTYLIPSAVLADVNSTHLAFYSLAAQAPGDHCDMGCYNWAGSGSRFHIIAYYTSGEFYYGMSEDGITSCPGIGHSAGLFVSTRTSFDFQAGYRNGVLNGSSVAYPSKGLPPVSVHIGGINYYQQGPSDLPCGFASVGTGLERAGQRRPLRRRPGVPDRSRATDLRWRHGCEPSHPR